MKPEGLRIGDTYRVHIPRRDSPAKHLTRDPDRSDVDLALAQLALSRATDFDITITSLDVEPLGDEPAVTGVRVVDTAHVRTPLASDVAAALGLPTDVEYVVEGVLKDAASDDLVPLLTEQTITIPRRWLRPLPPGG